MFLKILWIIFFLIILLNEVNKTINTFNKNHVFLLKHTLDKIFYLKTEFE